MNCFKIFVHEFTYVFVYAPRIENLNLVFLQRQWSLNFGKGCTRVAR